MFEFFENEKKKRFGDVNGGIGLLLEKKTKNIWKTPIGVYVPNGNLVFLFLLLLFFFLIFGFWFLFCLERNCERGQLSQYPLNEGTS